MTNTKDINLNLLVALEALLTECHVSRAATKVGVTQSAMSLNLKQLRELFADELLVKISNRYVLTSKAISLLPQVQSITQSVDTLMGAELPFLPEASTREFTVAMSDYIEMHMLPFIIQRLEKCNAKTKINIVNQNLFDTAEPFDNSDLDFGIGIINGEPDNLIARALYNIDIVCFGHKDNPLLQNPLTKKSFYESQFIGRHDTSGSTDLLGMACDYQKHIQPSITVSQILPIIVALTKNKTAISTIPRQLVKQLAKPMRLTYQELPFDYEKLQFHLIWHKKSANDKGMIWLKTLLLDILKKDLALDI